MSIESMELVKLRSDQFAMAAHQANAECGMRSAELDRPTLQEVMADAAEETRRKKCLCCGQWRQIRVMMHVCEPCFNELEDER